MTSTVNGIGTHLSGERKITAEELVRWSEHLPIKPYTPHPEFYIATESFVFIFLPIFPIKTFVYYYAKQGVVDSQYYICYYPAGEDKIYWEHVKNGYIFYVIPAILSALFISYLIGGVL